MVRLCAFLRNVHDTTDQSNLGRVIDVLPDDMLLEIFGFYVNDKGARITKWHTLVHVCRRWRELVFASPHHLNLRLEYTGNHLWKKTLDTWPNFPVVISDRNLRSLRRWGNIAATLDSGYHDRISEIELSNIPNSQLEKVAAVMQKPFPALTKLFVSVKCDTVLIIPNSFLGGSAPRLHNIQLRSCPFPGMQKLLLSAKDLVTLSLEDIPHSGYISPDEMTTALSVMTRLKSLNLSFISPQSRPDPESQPPPPLTRTILPALTQLTFKGVHEYSEPLMAQIDAPLLENISVTFFMDLIVRVPQLYRFISQIGSFKIFRRAKVFGGYESIVCTFSPSADKVDNSMELSFKIRCERVDWQLSSLAQVCSSSLSPISIVEELEIELRPLASSSLRDDMEPESTQWLELLGPFTAVKNLTLSPGVTSRVCNALKEKETAGAGERVTKVLPALQNLFIYDGYSLKDSRKAIKIFVAARRRDGHPVSVHSGPWGGTRKDITEDLASGD